MMPTDETVSLRVALKCGKLPGVGPHHSPNSNELDGYGESE